MDPSRSSASSVLFAALWLLLGAITSEGAGINHRDAKSTEQRSRNQIRKPGETTEARRAQSLQEEAFGDKETRSNRSNHRTAETRKTRRRGQRIFRRRLRTNWEIVAQSLQANAIRICRSG